MANTITISILGDASKFNRTVAQVEGRTEKWSKRLKGFATSAAGAFAGFGVAAGIKSSIDAASDLNESINKVGVVFGENAKDIQKWAKNAASSLGISRQEALESAGTFGNLFSAMKIGLPTATNMSKRIVGLASDLASFNNANPNDVLEALRSGLVGEVEPLRKFGVNLSAVRVQQEAVRLGLAKQGEQLTAAQKAQAAYSIILQDTKTAQGDFARTSGGLANQQRILAAKFKDVQAQLGKYLVPVLTKLAVLFTKHTGLILSLVSALAGLFIIAKIVMGVKALMAAVSALNVVMAANPVGAIVLGLVALGAALVIAYKKWKPFHDAVDATARFFQKYWKPLVIGALTAVIGPIVAVVAAFIYLYNHVEKFREVVRGVFNAVVKIISGAVEIIQGIIDVFLGLIHGDWDRVWRGIQKIVHGAFKAIIGYVQGGLTLLKAYFVDILGAVVNVVRHHIGLIVQWFASLPGRILRVLGDVAHWLYETGKHVIHGLFEGMKDAFTSEKGWLSNLGHSIIKSIPGLGGAAGLIPGFSSGGKVPGAFGKPRLAVVHGGEYVVGLDAMRKFNAPHAQPTTQSTPAPMGGGLHVENLYALDTTEAIRKLRDEERRRDYLYGWG